MSKEKINLLKSTIKNLNSNFQDGFLMSDAAFKQIENSINPTDIKFASRINNGQGLIIGLQDNIVIIEKGALMVLSTPPVSLNYSEIDNTQVNSKFTCDQIIIFAGRKELIFEIDKFETDYIVKSINAKIITKNTNNHQSAFKADVNFKDIKLDIVGRNFDNDFKLVSNKEEIIFQKKGLLGVEKIRINGNVQNIVQLTEENKQSMLKKAGWGFAGGVIGGVFGVGLIGMAAGLLAKGNKKEICFACELQTGEKFLAKTDNETFQKLLAISMM
ncbi:hypothetical protein [Anaerosinus sp.]